MTWPFRPELDTLVPYVPGRPAELVQRELGIERPMLKLASNEGAWGMVPAARAAVERVLAETNRYPDGGSFELRRALAARHGVGLDQVVIGNGADGVLGYLSLALLEPGDEVAYCWPSFPVYPINAAKMGAISVRCSLDGSAYDLDALHAAVNEQTKLVYVTNPNNPTGGMVDREALQRFLDTLPERVVCVLDEAYFEYVADPGYPDGALELQRGRRIVALRTFSKIYGLAGLRVGYGLMPVDLAEACVKVKGAFDVSAVAQAAALGSLSAGDEIARRREQTVRERDALAQALQQRGLEPMPSVANFLCLEVGDGLQVAAALEREGVIVRGLAGFGYPEAIRVTVGTADENEQFLAALARVLH